MKDNLRLIHDSNNYTYWRNQQRISLWNDLLGNINWNNTMTYLSVEDKPQALSTNPASSNLKNFKIKLIADEIPTHLTLHLRNQKKNPSHLCPRCYSASEDVAHLLTCLANPTNFLKEIKYILNRFAEKNNLQLTDPDNFIRCYKELHIEKKVPIGIITNITLAPFHTTALRKKYTPPLHHLIVEYIYKNIWIPSRAARHNEAVPNPTPIPTPTFTKTKPPTPLQIRDNILHHIVNCKTPNKILFESIV